MKTGIELIAEERARQIELEGWTQEHDDQHTAGELAKNAAICAVRGTDAYVIDPSDGPDWLLASKHGEPVKRLIIAGALIAAEIDRLQRAALREGGEVI